MKAIKLFIAALDLIGINNDGEKLPADTEDLKLRAVSLINTLLAENAVIDSRIRGVKTEITSVQTLEDTLTCSDIISNSVLPYGLAHLLILGEDDILADKLYRMYLASCENARRFTMARAHPITEVYK